LKIILSLFLLLSFSTFSTFVKVKGVVAVGSGKGDEVINEGFEMDVKDSDEIEEREF